MVNDVLFWQQIESSRIVSDILMPFNYRIWTTRSGRQINAQGAIKMKVARSNNQSSTDPIYVSKNIGSKTSCYTRPLLMVIVSFLPQREKKEEKKNCRINYKLFFGFCWNIDKEKAMDTLWTCFSKHKSSLWQSERSSVTDKINSVEWEFREIIATHRVVNITRHRVCLGI